MIKKYTLGSMLAAFLLALFIIPLAKVSADTNLLFGQQHAYSVYLKDNHEAFVFARLSFANPESTALTNTSFTLADATASELSVYQVVLPQECVDYDYETSQRTCVRYQEPKYTSESSFYGSGYGNSDEIEYYKATYEESNGKYSVALPKEVAPYKSAALIVIYATKDYVTGSLGRFDFDFQTLAVETRVTEANVAVMVGPGYTIKNADASDSNSYAGIRQGISAAAADSSFSNPDVDKLVYEIGGKGQHNQTFNSITPKETEHVSGVFASNWFLLYLPELLITISVIAIVFALVIVVHRKYGKRLRILSRRPASAKTKRPNSFSVADPIYWVASFASTATLGLLTYAAYGAFSYNGYFSSYVDSPIAGMFIVIIIGLMYLFAIFGPAAYVASRRGWRAALIVIAFQFVMYIAAAALFVGVFNTTPTPSSVAY